MARQRGRKSTAAQSIALVVDVSKQRIRPRADDPADVQAVVAELIAAVDAEQFREADWPLLTSYAQAILMERKAYAQLAAEGVVTKDGRTSAWLTVAEKAGRQIVALSLRLRLAPQSRLDPRSVARRPGDSSQRPWSVGRDAA